jgi:alkanesulfonate monooxygenase SsuD/methylene tetrahydromethanopterin reductase-like flavin-dependent oxidoreductase (luciferase family)
MPGISPVIGRTRAEAEDKYAELQNLVDPRLGLALLAGMAGGFDLSQYPLDGPLPELPESNAMKSRQALFIDLARRENLSIRQLYLKIAGARGHHTLIGTAQDVADVLEEWFTQGAADGFNIMPSFLPEGLDEFVDQVVPELQRRGLFRGEYEGRTLRENLGLARPLSRYALKDLEQSSQQALG